MNAMKSSINVSVTIDPEPLHPLPKTQYGHFIEHLGRCIKGGIWAEEESDDMFLGGTRRELVEAMKSINPALIRYPGGCFADGYHWKDGIGPRDKRPVRKNRAWAKLGKRLGPRENNRFGTDEFLQLCEELGAEPQLTVNVGSGTVEEAVAWVEYCNGTKDSRWGAERARNGHNDPYGVKYWFIGNEIFGWHEIGHQSPPRYVKTFNEYARAMRKVDPNIKLIGCGTFFPTGKRTDINPTVLKGAGEEMDYLSIHRYAPNLYSLRHHWRYQVRRQAGSPSRKIYYDIIGTIKIVEEFVEQCVRDVRTHSPAGKKVPLSFDEWNLWFAFFNDIFQANYNVRDGLWVAGMFNMFHRYAPDMPLANIAQMVNCLGIISSTHRGTFLTPSAMVFKIYTEHAGDELLQSRVDGPAIPHETGLPVLDVSATRSGDKVSLFAVNLHYDNEVVTTLNLKGLDIDPGAAIIEMSHENPVQYNTFSKPDEVRIRERSETIQVTKEGTGSCFQMRLAPHSLTCLELKVKDA